MPHLHLVLFVCMSAHVCTWGKGKRKEEHRHKMRLHPYRNQHHCSPIGKNIISSQPNSAISENPAQRTCSASPQEMCERPDVCGRSRGLVWRARCVWQEQGSGEDTHSFPSSKH